MKLYELTEQHKELAALVESGELTEDMIADTMEGIEGEFNDKAIALVKVAENMDADTTALDQMIKQLQDRKKVIENKQKSLKDYLRMNMEASEITKIECPYFTITLAQGRDMVEVMDVEKIPLDYIDFKTERRPNKKDLLAALKDGKDIPGVTLTKTQKSLRFK